MKRTKDTTERNTAQSRAALEAAANRAEIAMHEAAVKAETAAIAAQRAADEAERKQAELRAFDRQKAADRLNEQSRRQAERYENGHL